MSRQQVFSHFLVILALFLLAVICDYSGFDLFWTGHFYDATQHAWPYKNTFITATLLHDGGKHFVSLLVGLNILALSGSYFHAWLAPYRKALFYLLLVSVSGPSIVTLLKAHTHIYTPWKLELFNSYRPYVHLFDHVSGNLPVGHAFPGGHSSGGFAFVGLYFLATAHNHPWRYHALAFPLVLGGIFAVDQEIRGAHFISHDLLSLAICWLVAIFWYLVFFGLEKEAAMEPAFAPGEGI